MFNFGDNVDRDNVDRDKVERSGDSRLSTNWRQIDDKDDNRLCRRFWRLSSTVCTGLKQRR